MSLGLSLIEERFIARKNLVGKRLDLAIVAAGFKLSRRHAKTIIDSGNAFVNGEKVRIASRELSFGDEVRIVFEKKAKPTRINQLDVAMIVYRDEQIVVLNKPAGLATQASKKDDKLQVIPLLKKLAACQNWEQDDFRLVHRLDKDTSGLLAIACSENAERMLIEQFRSRSVKKKYEAIVHGQISQDFYVDLPLSGINPKSGKVKVSAKGGKTAQSNFSSIHVDSELKLSVLSCEPITGRSHQLRVHLLAKGFPILGDKIYAAVSTKLLDKLGTLHPSRHMLHARNLELIIPGKEERGPVAFKAPYPEDFASLKTYLLER